jgi:plastocyanin domain-containing protein
MRRIAPCLVFFLAVTGPLLLATAAAAEAAVPAEATITVTDHGFVPARVVVPAGRTVVIAFRRTAAATCATAVLWPQSGLRQELPVGQEVRISLRAAPDHPIAFTCPSGMYHGDIVVASPATAPASASATRAIDVTVDESGFHPQRIAIALGGRTILRFTRTSAGTCATAVRIPELGIADTNLPLGVAIEIAVSPTASGTIAFACPMGMVTGTLVVGSPAGADRAP